MTRRVHVSWQIAALAAGVLLGVALSLLPQAASFTSPAWLVVAIVLVGATVVKRLKWMIMLTLTAGVLVGLWRGGIQQLHLTSYTPYYGQEVAMQGRVARDVTRSSGGDMQLHLDKIMIDGRSLKGQVWAGTRIERRDVKRGDIVTVEGKFSEGFGTFAGSLFRARIVVVERPVPGDVGRQVRDWFAARVRQAVPEPEASLGISYVAGQRTALPEDLGKELRMLGLVHLVVASGFHLTLVVRYVRRPLMYLSKYMATAGSFLLIGGFLLVSGFSTSMIRASMVTALSLLAWYYGRSIHPVVLLLFVAALTVMLDPSFIWGDVGWYLSFAAFGGVIILAPLLHRYFWGTKKSGWFRDVLIATVAAQITTLPIIVYTFGEYSPLALLANLLIQPLVGLAMFFTFIGGAVGAVVPAFATTIGWPAHTLLSYMTLTTDWLSGLPWAQEEMVLSSAGLATAYMGILLLTFFLWRRTGHNFREENIVD